MKTKNLIFAFVALLFAANVFATETSKMNVTPMDETKLLIAVIPDAQTANEISILNQSGDLMYFKRLKKGSAGYKRVYDLSQLVNGDYEVRLKYGKTSLTKTININDGVISLVEEKQEIPPHFLKADGGVNLTYLNFAEKNVFISVYKQGQLLQITNLGSDFTIHKKINFSALKKGKYDILLAGADKEFWFSVYF